MFISSIKSSADFMRTLTAWLLICAVFMTLLPVTHADHSNHMHDSHVHNIENIGFKDNPEPTEQAKHQHIGLNEHHTGLTSLVDHNFSLNLHFAKLQLLKSTVLLQDFIYWPDRPPKF